VKIIRNFVDRFFKVDENDEGVNESKQDTPKNSGVIGGIVKKISKRNTR
jgi:hypothetical protein